MSEPPQPISPAKRPFTVVCRVDDSASYFVPIEATTEVVAAIAARRLGHTPVAVRWTDETGVQHDKPVTIHRARPKLTCARESAKEQVRAPAAAVAQPRPDAPERRRRKRRRPIRNYHTPRKELERALGVIIIAMTIPMCVFLLIAGFQDGTTSTYGGAGYSASATPTPEQVYWWCQDRWDQADREGNPISERDSTMFRLAAEHFQISVSDAEALYMRGGVEAYDLDR